MHDIASFGKVEAPISDHISMYNINRVYLGHLGEISNSVNPFLTIPGPPLLFKLISIMPLIFHLNVFAEQCLQRSVCSQTPRQPSQGCRRVPCLCLFPPF